MLDEEVLDRAAAEPVALRPLMVNERARDGEPVQGAALVKVMTERPAMAPRVRARREG
jgi:hypothetical protein